MAEIDRRSMVRGMLYCAAFAAAGSGAITTPELAKAVPLAADKTGPLETDDLLDADDLRDMNAEDYVQQVQYWYRRRRRRRWRCWWRRGRRVCVRRW
jgi:hypothetical protein